MEKFKEMVATVLVYMGVIVLFVICGVLLLMGVLTIFGSMFFEVTASQITLLLVLQHIGIFIAGVFFVAIGLVLLFWLLG